MHLLMCAIHSAFSVGVAANTANDFFGEITCQPFFHAGERERERERERWLMYGYSTCTCTLYMLYGWLTESEKCEYNLRPSFSSDCSLTSSRGRMCCLLY